ncbi:MarR family protein [Streptococcus parasanguinis]|uniref:MarR family winged helix-turn-helix transcriptional regulator n=1 Tax=Streptococcus parasanguinis TaxID=1318 RepID=UPI0019608C15|nr:helix-turn-helix domain-containing protein [Streptococcus parasanguinis]VTY22286.1 MarR family protein [Streptococcus parasanguinis]
MDKPLQEFKKVGHLIHLLVEREAKKRGFEFFAGPQGQVLVFLSHREKEGKVTLIRDIEQELHISKSVASNLIKRMERNGFIYIEPSPTDKRAKFVFLVDSVKANLKDMKLFFEEVDQSLVAGVSEEELTIFFKVMQQFYENMKKRSKE